MTIGVLCITYDGILEPLGQSQVLSYVSKLASNHRIVLVSFEKKGDWNNKDRREALRVKMDGAGIKWVPLRYHKHPSALASAYDIVQGAIYCAVVAIRYRLQIVHARSYVPSVIALALHNLLGVKFVFDMRGFWADERVDGGLWRVDSRLFRMAKWFESRFLLNADHVVSLTWAAKWEIEEFSELRGRVPPITVVPTCVDLERFRPLSGRRDGFVLGYVGSAGTWYNFESAAQCFGLLRQVREDARFLILNRGEHDLIRTELERQGIPNAVIELRTVEYSEIPSQMARMHAGVFFIKPLYSKLASMPTKLAEFLACGVPCISNQRIGDMTEILEGERVGVAVPDFTETSIYNGLDRLLKLTEEDGLSDRCAAAAQMHFSLDEGVKRYAAIYERLAGSK